MKVTQVISWEGDHPVWIAEGGLLPYTEKVELLNFIANLEWDDAMDLTELSIPLVVGEGKQTRIVHLEAKVRGLDTSKNDPSKAYLLSELLPKIQPRGIDLVVDSWSINVSHEKISAEIDEKKDEGDRKRGSDFARHIVLFRDSVFLASRVPLNKDEEEILLLLPEHQLNERAIESQRLRRRVERQRRVLAHGAKFTDKHRRMLAEDLIRFILEWDKLCYECASDEHLRLVHMPVARGKDYTERNLRLLCRECNGRHGALNL